MSENAYLLATLLFMKNMLSFIHLNGPVASEYKLNIPEYEAHSVMTPALGPYSQRLLSYR